MSKGKQSCIVTVGEVGSCFPVKENCFAHAWILQNRKLILLHDKADLGLDLTIK